MRGGRGGGGGRREAEKERGGRGEGEEGGREREDGGERTEGGRTGERELTVRKPVNNKLEHSSTHLAISYYTWSQ